MEKAAVLMLRTAKKIDSTIEDKIGAVTDKLTKADDLLATIAIEDARATEVADPQKQKIIDKEIAKAEKELEKARRYLEEDRPDSAINHFKLAWVCAQKALKIP